MRARLCARLCVNCLMPRPARAHSPCGTCCGGQRLAVSPQPAAAGLPRPGPSTRLTRKEDLFLTREREICSPNWGKALGNACSFHPRRGPGRSGGGEQALNCGPHLQKAQIHPERPLKKSNGLKGHPGARKPGTAARALLRVMGLQMNSVAPFTPYAPPAISDILRSEDGSGTVQTTMPRLSPASKTHSKPEASAATLRARRWPPRLGTEVDDVTVQHRTE